MNPYGVPCPPQTALLRPIASTLSQVADSLGGGDFGSSLLQFLRGQCDFDSAMVLLYDPRRRPRLLAEDLAHPLRRNSVAAYLGGAYLLDPMFARASRVSEPTLVRLADIAPVDFPDSEYVRSYYKDSHIVDELNYLLPQSDGAAYAVCLERSRSSAPFDETELERFELWLPLLQSLFRQHALRLECDGDPPDRDRGDPEHERLQQVLTHFGRDRLTPREHEIAQLLLRGRSTPIIAAELHVSAQTVRVHRRNIYDKLDISSLGELFTLAMRRLLAEQA